MTNKPSIVAIVPAAGVGSRMQADRPKQYLTIGNKTVLEHTIEKLLSHSSIARVVVAISEHDPYFAQLPLSDKQEVIRVSGGGERADSVLSALDYVASNDMAHWVMVHDAARPCVCLADIDKLINQAMSHTVGGIMATPVRDTMKRSDATSQIQHTVERELLWHALTPQMFRTEPLRSALSKALQENVTITDEASAMEWAGFQPLLVQGRADNIKITQPEDLDLAKYYLNKQP
ncbi:2-C-methyl-D-erythritol 4-phosphate cytidylyltransferase [Vibrio sp. S4M6]|uniref:2-C-methyl-D-erythritol 4-phosphate cytidylyltransferase n=1 Tax=Vibrio sinus TaxID=2946865 RepID=UPI00202AA337|nr:2-C-methyl-D-erythritol 4-phosphate cytidylyltransferase [Vibrio sinus]MCL9780978.1 2-C-methyl-D-erythritol 4-phosphate cytidylyltransferase [Vibrio sinus]